MEGVLGIDPGLHCTGYALLGDQVGPGAVPPLHEAGVIRLPRRAALADRLLELHGELEALIERLAPRCLAVEQLYAHYRHPRTAILMGHARGVVLLAARRADLSVLHLPATEVKKSLTGYGRASKQQIQRAVQERCNLPAPPEPADVGDAIAVGLCAARRR
jgi:crossover junction endodeoxyribonuclease RuvC